MREISLNILISAERVCRQEERRRQFPRAEGGEDDGRDCGDLRGLLASLLHHVRHPPLL